MGYENIKDKGFDSRSTEELREIASRGGKASGEARRRKADFRKTLNMLLTTKIDSPEWTAALEAMGLESTLESAVNASMIRKALGGNVKAYEAIAKYSGQGASTEADLEEQKVRTEAMKEKTRQKDNNEGMAEMLKNIQTMADIMKHPAEDRDIEDYE